MHLSAEVLDHIFSFLVSDRGTLSNCLKDPVLSPIVERHFYHHVIIDIPSLDDSDGRTNPTNYNYAFGSIRLSNLVSDNPRILKYVRILEIQVGFDYDRSSPLCQTQIKLLDRFAKTLLMFPMLQGIILSNPDSPFWHWPDAFRAALEDRLNLRTLQTLHLHGSEDFPLSILDHCKNVENLLLSGSFTATEGQISDQALPQLKSLILFAEYNIPDSLLAWIKLHINQLQSLRCGWSIMDIPLLSQLFETCSPTLNNLDVNFAYMAQYCTGTLMTGRFDMEPLPKLLHIPPNLRQLTIRTAARLFIATDGSESWLPAAAKLITPFIPSLQHLILDLCLRLSTASGFCRFDFSPLAILEDASLSVQRIDLYVHTGHLPSVVTQAHMLASLEGYEGIMRLIKGGVLVIHPEETAPDM